jgi:hypothetical protein
MAGEEPGKALKRKQEFLVASVHVLAAGGGAYLAQLFGPAAAAGAAQALAEVGEKLVGVLGKFEARRILRTVTGFKSQVDDRVAAGEAVRADIIDPEDPQAAELFESVVEAAARSIEEKKCDLIANFYASVAFDDQVSVSDALLYLRRIRASSWRQLVALRYFEDDSRAEERELIGAAGGEGEARIHAALGTELSELGRSLELIGIGQDDGSVANPANTVGLGMITSQSVGRMRATGLGETIARLGRLADLVTDEEMDTVRDDLRSDERPRKDD